MVSSDNFFFKIGVYRAPQFSLIGQKWYFGSCGEGIFNPLHPDFEKKLSEDTKDRKEYRLGITLSHIWAFLGSDISKKLFGSQISAN